MKGRCTTFLIALSFTASSQAYLPLNNEYELILLNGRHTMQFNFHPSSKPFLIEELEKDSFSLNEGFLFKQKKHVHKEDVNIDLSNTKNDTALKSCSDSGRRELIIEAMPLMNFSYGMGKSGDSSDVSHTAGLGLEVSLRHGRKLKAVFDYLYSGNKYSDYVDECVSGTGVLPGMGEAYRKGSLYYNKYYSGYIWYRPAEFITLEAGRGKQFIGNGYRSLLLSDNSNASNYGKIVLQYWKLRYQVVYSWMQSSQATPGYGITDRRNKYSTTSFLSMNFGKSIGLGLFQSVVWSEGNGENRGFDVNYLNPVIFVRPVEYSIGSPDNVILGADLRCLFLKKYTLYGQVALDEFLLKEFMDNQGWWGNKFGIQAGLKGFDIFNVKGLAFLGEMNWVRPYTYSHNDVQRNYSHDNEALAHNAGANFAEVLARLSYTRKQWLFLFHAAMSEKGEDSPLGGTNYGGNIFLSNSDRESEDNNSTGQGFSTNRTWIQFKVGKLIVPDYRLMLEAAVTQRMESMPDQMNIPGIASQNLMFSLTLRTAFLNQYTDF